MHTQTQHITINNFDSINRYTLSQQQKEVKYDKDDKNALGKECYLYMNTLKICTQSD